MSCKGVGLVVQRRIEPCFTITLGGVKFSSGGSISSLTKKSGQNCVNFKTKAKTNANLNPSVLTRAVQKYRQNVKKLCQRITPSSGPWKWSPSFVPHPKLVHKDINTCLVKSRHSVIDLSNLIRGAKRHLDQHGRGRILSKFGLLRLFGVDVDYRGVAQKPGDTCTIAGSVGSGEFSEAEKELFIGLGCNVLREETVGTEQAVDDFLHLQIMKLVSQSGIHEPGSRLLILATGDGNENHGRTNFPECIHLAASNGFMVEIHSWKKSLSSNLREVQKLFPPGQIIINYLDDVKDQILEPLIYTVDGIDPYDNRRS